MTEQDMIQMMTQQTGLLSTNGLPTAYGLLVTNLDYKKTLSAHLTYNG